MKRSKQNGVPRMENIPPPPELKNLSIEDTCGIILNALKCHEPSDQNKILEFVNNHIASARYDAYLKAQDDQREAGMNFEKFIASTHGIEEFIKRRSEQISTL